MQHGAHDRDVWLNWRIAVDIGGTFTDLVAWNKATNTIVRTKVLSVPDDPVKGVVQAVDKAGLALDEVAGFIHGSTIAINAVLQESGATTALLTTKGFRDVLEMGRKSRPDMYNLFFRPRICPVPRENRLEVSERLDFTGAILLPLDTTEVASLADALPPNVESVAICFLHAYANPDHERSAAQIVRERRPGVFVSASTDLSREAREYERTCTAVVNAYVGPLVARYTGQLAGHLTAQGCTAPLLITQSNGGVMTADVAMREPVRTMESGPAAGVTGAAWIGGSVGTHDLIAFDMGGTSAKACVIESGEPEMCSEYYIGGSIRGLPVQVPFLDIIEVGAGGGSVAFLDSGGGLRVGPRSAGSEPGPASYNRGGREPTITDANVVAGRIDADYFLGGEMPLRSDLARAAVGKIAGSLQVPVDECARGIIRIANSIMSEAIKAVTLKRGRDPRDFTLVAYGGAGPVHAAALAAELHIPRILIPAGPGTFAAFGMLVTDMRHDVARTVSGRIDNFSEKAIEGLFTELEADAARYVKAQLDSVGGSTIKFVRKMDLRYVGQFHPLMMTVPRPLGSSFATDIANLFHQAHEDRYGHNAPAEAIEIGAVRVTAIGEVTKPMREDPNRRGSRRRACAQSRSVLFEDGTWHRCAVHRRDDMRLGDVVAGPAIIDDPATNVVIPGGDCASVIAGGHLLISVGGASQP